MKTIRNIFFTLTLTFFLSGCVTVLQHGQVDPTNGIDKSEALTAAQRHILDSGSEYSYKIKKPSSVELSGDSWFFTFPGQNKIASWKKFWKIEKKEPLVIEVSAVTGQVISAQSVN